MLAKAATTECNGVFFAVSCNDVGDEWMGGSEQLIKALYEKDSAQLFSYFRTVARARARLRRKSSTTQHSNQPFKFKFKFKCTSLGS